MASARQLCVIALMAAASPSAWAVAVEAFGQDISIPQNTPSGSILARHYISPMEACGQLMCTAEYLWNFVNGGGNTANPPITTNVSGISTRLLINGRTYPNAAISPPVEFSRPLEVQLISDGRPNLGGSLAGIHTSPAYFWLKTKQSKENLVVILKGTITPIDGTCSVPSQTVKLPKAQTTHLERIGSTAGIKNFQLQINNCPKGYNRVGYTLEPVGGVLANAPGVLPLAVGSTASGVKIRVANDRGEPMTMGTSLKVDAYQKAIGGSYAIPMQASYIRTDTVLKPGTVNGAVTVFLDYR